MEELLVLLEKLRRFPTVMFEELRRFPEVLVTEARLISGSYVRVRSECVEYILSLSPCYRAYSLSTMAIGCGEGITSVDVIDCSGMLLDKPTLSLDEHHPHQHEHHPHQHEHRQHYHEHRQHHHKHLQPHL